MVAALLRHFRAFQLRQIAAAGRNNDIITSLFKIPHHQRFFRARGIFTAEGDLHLRDMFETRISGLLLDQDVF